MIYFHVIQKNMDRLRHCMDAGDYASARPLYEDMQSKLAACQDISAQDRYALTQELAEIFAAMVIETNSQAEIPAAIPVVLTIASW